MFVFNTNMKITNINSPVIYRNRFSKKKENKSFDTTSNGYLSFGRTTSFFNFFIPHKPTQSEEYKQRIAKLKEEEIQRIKEEEKKQKIEQLFMQLQTLKKPEWKWARDRLKTFPLSAATV